MKHLYITLFSLLFSLSSFAQRSYLQYKILFDSSRNICYVKDTATGFQFDIPSYFGHASPYFSHRFECGFVRVKAGDMYALMDLNGRILLSPSHFILMNRTDSLVSAYVCGLGGWVIMDFNGDTMSYGRAHQNNYIPYLKDSINPAAVVNDDRRKVLWGYLNKKGKWVIEPQYQQAEEFKNGVALVVIEDKWYEIDTSGKVLRKVKK